jgi:type III pantothenate kinase
VSGPIVVDVGNTRIKWGRCYRGRVVEMASLAPDAPDAWKRQLEQWPAAPTAPWIVSGVHRQRRDALTAWLRDQGVSVQVLDSYRQLPLTVEVEAPEQVGIDRLLNAVAANTRRHGKAAAIVDAGSAVTVDYVDRSGVFRGGAIFPGLRLMAKALHDYTAALPLVEVERAESPPATSTNRAIRAGLFHAVTGGIHKILKCYGDSYHVYVTGGDAALLTSAHDFFLDAIGHPWPEMTLEGILHSVPDVASHV